MSYRRALEQRRADLNEIRSIMGSMKNLAFMETRRIARNLEHQQKVIDSMEAMAADLLQFHPELLLKDWTDTHLILLVGSERGFCGDFNEQVLERLAAEQAAPSGRKIALIAVGHKLNSRLSDDGRVVAAVPGAHVAEEIAPVLGTLIARPELMKSIQAGRGLKVIFHAGEGGGVQSYFLLPPFQRLPKPALSSGYPAQLNLSPQQCFSELLDHYLFAMLHQIFYLSLLAENHQRVEHLEMAIHRIEEKTDELARQCRTLRQEEITEEIEVILLNSEGGLP